MLTPNEYDHLCDQLMQIYWALDDAIIADITRRLMKTGGDYLPDMGVIQAERMQQAGLLYEDIINEVAKRSGMTQRQVAKTFERAGVQSIRNDNRSYRAAGLEGIVKMSDACLQTLNAGYVKCNGELQNLTLTTANTAQTAYLNACDLAYMQVSTGTLDYQTAIRRAVRAAADQGAFVLYPSGHRDRLDVAVRRSVLTGVGQTVRKLSEINAHDMDCDLMEITAHAGARPTHAVWQGRIVSLSGRRGYLSVKDIGWGDADGFGGINCRHDWLPFFEGISHRAYTDADLQALNEPYIDLGDGKLYTDYEVSQMQRGLEREVRKCKRWVSGAAAGVDSAQDEIAEKFMKAELTDASVALKNAEKKLQDFCNRVDVRNDSFRTEVIGFGRSEAQRAVWANKKAASSARTFATPGGGVDVLREYVELATPNKGRIIKDNNLNEKSHTDEISFANWLHNVFGGDIRIIQELNQQKVETPDYLWNGKLWDLKTVTTEKAANHAVRKGLSQISKNPGGVMLNYKEADVSKEKLIEVIDKRMQWYKDIAVDIMVVKGDKPFMILRYKK